MAASDIYKAYCWQAKGVTLTARVRDLTGSLVTQASLTSITRYVYDLDNSAALVGTDTLTISASVFDTLQALAADLVLWQRDGQLIDSTGWNFKDVVPATRIPKGISGSNLYRQYQVEYVFDPTSGQDYSIAYILLARNLYSAAES